MMQSSENESASKLDLVTIEPEFPRSDPDLHERIKVLESERDYALKNPPKTPKTLKQKILSVALVISGLFSTIAVIGICLLYIRTETVRQCQAEFNKQFQEAVSERTKLTAPENEARDLLFEEISTFIKDMNVVNGENVAIAFQKYRNIRAATEVVRQKNQVEPPANNSC